MGTTGNKCRNSFFCSEELRKFCLYSNIHFVIEIYHVKKLVEFSKKFFKPRGIDEGKCIN